jgi:hypothetical protein
MDYSSDDMSEFIRLVRDMRAKQRKFFVTRNQNDMIIAKAAEQQVDGYLSHFAEIAWKQPEPTVVQKPLL